MLIDIIVIILLVYGGIKGFQKGLIVAIFSILAFIIGIAAAIKLSAVVAGQLGRSVKIPEQWLPVISFSLVFFVVVLLVKLGASAIQRVINMAFLGSVNRIGGMILYAALFIFIFSVILFYADQVTIIKPATKEASVTWKYVHPLGPKVIEALGKVIPIFKDMFTGLQEFFDVSRDFPSPK